MASFKQLQENENIDNAYTNKAVVYLESEEDLQIIKERWFFDEGKEIEFKSVDSGHGGGCTQVINRVNTERDKGISAFGIVDRDALMRKEKWDLWWEIDDQQFKQAKPFGDYILVLRRWEIENYLLSPEELEIVLSDKEFRPLKNIDLVIQNLLKEAEDLKVLSAAMILSHENGHTFSLGFGLKDTGEALQKEVKNHLSNHIKSKLSLQLTSYIQKIEAFAEGNTKPTRQRWERLNRLLDGKRTLQRLDLFKSRVGERRGDLARHLRINNNIDSELMAYIKEIKQV
ncbi:MAG: DUF4435 domain-containing protein [Thiomargarita sp.]|nr:DUF4435 domain-containing protein [Thiomargarita sp.]